MEEKIQLGPIGLLAVITAALPMAVGVMQREYLFVAGSAAIIAVLYFLLFFNRKYTITEDEIIAQSGLIKLRMKKGDLNDILVVGPTSGYALGGIRLANTLSKQIYVLNPNKDALVVTPSDKFICELYTILQENLHNERAIS